MAFLKFDFRNPDYAAVYRARADLLREMRRDPGVLRDMKLYYRDNPADFINDWGTTFDPRNAERGLLTYIPMVLFPRQREWIDWVIERWRRREPGLVEKSRDMGVSWLAMSLSCTLCLFHRGVAIGVGSRKTEYVDKIGTLKPLLPKARIFMERLPEEFAGGWTPWRDAPYMRISFPETGSIISGEGGDDIGRGDRTSIYFVDEAAWLERPELVDAALSQTTNCRIDMSSVNGMNNPFARKRHEGKIEVFVFDWRHDPRKDQDWYDRQCAVLDPVVVAQEIDRDYMASVSGVVIPGPWVRSAIDALDKLGLRRSGQMGLALDVADEGLDKNALCGSIGTEVVLLQEWSGKGGDLFQTAQRAFDVCDEFGYPGFTYDADGLGAGIRGDARMINETRRQAGARPKSVEGFRGSAEVFDPDGVVEGTIGTEGDKGRLNRDYFANRKAQAWWDLRSRFKRVHRWITEGIRCDPDEIISISSKTKMFERLVTELSQPTYSVNGVGKIVINKKPDGMKSPNLADACMMRFARNTRPPLAISPGTLMQIARAGRSFRRLPLRR